MKSKSKKKIIYDDEFMLTSTQIAFMDKFKATHNFKISIASLDSKAAQESVKQSLKMGNNDLYKCYNKYIDSSPLHPEVNKVVILNDLIRLKDMAFEDGDTALLMKVIPEINKMIKGNLASTTEKRSSGNKLIGVIDLTRREDKMLEEGTIIDITDE